jgi:hypothetical protein
MDDHYKTLGVGDIASFIKLKRAYRVLALEYHPSQEQNKANNTVKFKEMSNAYSVLRNIRWRKEYDKAKVEGESISEHVCDPLGFVYSVFGTTSHHHALRVASLFDAGLCVLMAGTQVTAGTHPNKASQTIDDDRYLATRTITGVFSLSQAEELKKCCFLMNAREQISDWDKYFQVDGAWYHHDQVVLQPSLICVPIEDVDVKSAIEVF